MSTPHDGWSANPGWTLEEIVNNAIANANRTEKRVAQLDYIRTSAEPRLNTASAEVRALFADIIRRASVLSEKDYRNSLVLLLQRNTRSYHVVTVWLDDLLDELGVVERSPLRDEVARLLLAGPNERADPAKSMKEWKELLGRAPFPGGKDGPLAEAWDDWKKRLREKHPDYQKIEYVEGRSPYTTGNVQSLYTL